MIKTAVGMVKDIYFEDVNISKFVASIDEQLFHCISYHQLTGIVHVGDRVLLNTTAINLKLGTGGFCFVLTNLSNAETDNLQSGHIMKLRYTPLQINCMTLEAQESPSHPIFNEFESLRGLPVIIGSLHSSLAPVCIYLKANRPDQKICYLMSDGGALPIDISDIVRQLKKDGYIDQTITYGNAYGGDFECVNIYTALIAAKEILMTDIAVVCMGPGIVGTETTHGFSGVEQASIADAVNKLGGTPIIIPRISFADSRRRHFGISHHSMTILNQLCCTCSHLAIPILHDEEKDLHIKRQIEEKKTESLHKIYYVDTIDVHKVLSDYTSYLNIMGRNFREDREYFLTCGAAAKLSLRLSSV